MKQLNVLASNRPGALADILGCLAEQNINVTTADVETFEDSGVVAIIVDRYDDALRALTAAGHRAIAEEVLLLQVEDRPGALGAISRRLTDAGIDIRSLHILERQGQRSTVGVVTDNYAAARTLLQDILAA